MILALCLVSLCSELVFGQEESFEGFYYPVGNESVIEGNLRLIFQYNSSMPASSVIPFAFNVTEENRNDNLKVFGSCGDVYCNFMIVSVVDYLTFLQNPTLRALREKAIENRLLNSSSIEKGKLIFISNPGSYVLLSVNPSTNDTTMVLKAYFKHSSGRIFLFFLKEYWYIIIIIALVTIMVGLGIALIANKFKSRDLFSGMTSYGAGKKSERALITDEEIIEELNMNKTDRSNTTSSNGSSEGSVGSGVGLEAPLIGHQIHQ